MKARKNKKWLILLAGLALVLMAGSTGVTTGAFSNTEQSTGNTLRCWINPDYYLHNNPTPPTGNTNTQAVLPMNTTAPTATTLYNYDTDRNSDVGLTIAKGGSGAGETDLTKYQAWRTAILSNNLPLMGTVTVDLWSAMKNFNDKKRGVVTIYLRNYNGSTYTEIGNGTLDLTQWSGGSATWVKRTITISGLNYTVPAGNMLEVKIIVGNSSGDDMWFAYDTTSYPSIIKTPK